MLIQSSECRLKYKVPKGAEPDFEWIALSTLSNAEVMYDSCAVAPDLQLATDPDAKGKGKVHNRYLRPQPHTHALLQPTCNLQSPAVMMHASC